MAHLATNKFNYWGQLGILLVLLGGGMIFSIITSAIPLIGKVNVSEIMKGGSTASMINDLLKPENAGALRMVQFLSTLFLFFIPPFLYAWLCHVKPLAHLGFNKKVDVKEILIVVAIMFAALPMVATLQELTEMLPWSKAMMAKFKTAEDDYYKQVVAIARMNNVGDYLMSVFIIAFLPAVFEETLFRGAIQNLLSRWTRLPIVALIITSVLFSAIHGSYLGFLSRFALGFVLGWMYYRTSNIWLNIIAHFFNNALAITALYITSTPGKPIDPSKMDEHYPLWIGLISLIVVVALFKVFEKIVKPQVYRPGLEELMPVYSSVDHLFNENNQ